MRQQSDLEGGMVVAIILASLVLAYWVYGLVGLDVDNLNNGDDKELVEVNRW